jgi:NitT/TauT family transport system substrate-binding protein
LLTRSSLIAAALGVGVAAFTGPTSAPAQDLTPVTFVQPNPSAISSYPVFVAIEEGFFADEGLDVTVVTVDGSGAAVQAVAAGQAQFARPGPGVVLAARARGEDMVNIYNFAARSNFGIVVEEDSDFQTPADLKGHVIGVATADGSEVGFARNVLEGAGLVEGEDFTFLSVGDGGPAAAGFSRGDISAYAASLADAAILNMRGVPVRDITPVEFQKFFGNGLMAPGELIRTDPELVQSFINAWARAHAMGLDGENREAILGHLAAANPQEGEDPAFASALYDAILLNSTPIDPSHGLGWQPPDVWAEWHDVLVATGGLEAPLDDLSAAFTNEFAERAAEALQ